ncbi:MAG: helix-turn-helix domain-containing protein, partial [Betaproteobacteria bacterium]
KKMHYPVMTERQLALRWKISLKTLRRWRLDGEGPIWHKLFQHVRYHEADVLEFERVSAQHWTAILGDVELVPRAVIHPPKAKGDPQPPIPPSPNCSTSAPRRSSRRPACLRTCSPTEPSESASEFRTCCWSGTCVFR